MKGLIFGGAFGCTAGFIVGFFSFGIYFLLFAPVLAVIGAIIGGIIGGTVAILWSHRKADNGVEDSSGRFVGIGCAGICFAIFLTFVVLLSFYLLCLLSFQWAC